MFLWLKNIYLEGCGGGNSGEDYSTCMSISLHIKQDRFLWKERKERCTITIGDEPVHKSISNDILNHYIKQMMKKLLLIFIKY